MAELETEWPWESEHPRVVVRELTVRDLRALARAAIGKAGKGPDGYPDPVEVQIAEDELKLQRFVVEVNGLSTRAGDHPEKVAGSLSPRQRALIEHLDHKLHGVSEVEQRAFFGLLRPAGEPPPTPAPSDSSDSPSL